MSKAILSIAVLALAVPGGAFAQLSPAATWAVQFANNYAITPNVTYLVANNYEAKLDVYARRNTTGPQPTVIHIHGGGWTGGTKEAALPFLMPWFEMGWNVVNVEYRLAKVSLAPAAVEDCLCALRWIAANSTQYNLDTTRLVVTGDSAGGHLALTTGMIPESAGLDRQCPGVPLPKIAAIVNWYGITDVGDLLDGPNRRSFAVAWISSKPDREEAFFVAFSPDSKVLFGYRWKRADFPWLGMWEENMSRTQAPWGGKTLTQGMEFGVSPMPESRRKMIERGTLFGMPGYRWLPAKGLATAQYLAFITTANAIPDEV